MYSGKNVVLVVGLIVLIGVGAALSIWKAKTEEGNRRAAAEMTAKWQSQIDSLTAVVDSLRMENNRLQEIGDSLGGHKPSE